MIVVDASALLELFLRTAAAPAIEARVQAPNETLHAPHLIDVEVAQVLRRYARRGDIANAHGDQVLASLAAFPLRRYPIRHCCLGCGSCGTISAVTMLPI